MRRLLALCAMMFTCVWLMAATVKVRTNTIINAFDSSHDTAWPAGNKPPPGNQIKWHPGYYFDCYTNEVTHGDTRLALGNQSYNEILACMDFAALQTNVRGVFINIGWTSLEGKVLNCYSNCSNTLGSNGAIGFPLMDALLNYAASYGLKVIVMWQWYGVYTGPCGSSYGNVPPDTSFPAYLLQSSCTGGTDASGTYGVTWYTDPVSGYPTSLPWPRLWKANVMDRMIDVLNNYCLRYDNNSTLEQIQLMGQDVGVTGGAENMDGFTYFALSTQVARIPAAVRPNCAHTQFVVENNWMNPQIISTLAGASVYFGIAANNSIPWQTTYGERAYFGGGVQDGINWGSTDYRTLIPFTVWTAGPELCDQWDSKPGADAANNYTPLEFYNFYMTSGKTDSGGRPLRPSHWVIGRGVARDLCPSVASQQWGTLSSGGWYQMIQTHPLNTTAPSRFPAVNTN